MIMFQLPIVQWQITWNLVTQNNNYFILLAGSVDKEFRMGTARKTYLCFTMTEASAGIQEWGWIS